MCDRDLLAGQEAALGEVVGVGEEDHAATGDAAVAVVEAVDGGVELVVAADGHEEEFAGPLVEVGQREPSEAGLGRGGVPAALAGRVGEDKPVGCIEPGVVVFEAWDGPLDEASDAAVVGGDVDPGERAVAERRLGHAGHDHGLGEQVCGGRFEVAMRGVDAGHGVFDGDALEAGCLAVDLGAAEAGEDDFVAAADEVGAVEFGGDLGGPVAALESLCGVGGVGHGGEEVAAERDEDVEVAAVHGVDGFDGVETMLARAAEAERGIHAGEEGLGGLLVDAHGAIALHIAVAADGAEACALLAEMAAEQCQVDHLLDEVGGMLVLREPHGPAVDGAGRSGEELGGLAHGGAADAGAGHERLEIVAVEVGAEGLEALGVLVDEGAVDGARRGGLEVEQLLHEALHEGSVAADADLQVVGGEAGAADREGPGLFGVGEALEAGLDERVDGDDVGAAARCLLEGGEHAGVVGARVLADDEDGVGLVEVGERDGAFADAHRVAHRPAGGLVAEVGAVGQVVGAERADEGLVEEGGLVAGAAACVEGGAVGRVEPAERAAERGEELLPGDGAVVGVAVAADERLGDAALAVEPEVALGCE